MPYEIEPARIEWGADNVPVSSDYGDVYYSRDHGLSETRYVFLDNNRLTQRWQAANGNGFCIAETGFGTGLNFLACWQAWEAALGDIRTARKLQFISVEKHPLTRDDLKRALALWPELSLYADALLAQYPPLIRGHHRLCFDRSVAGAPRTIILDLIFDEAETGLGNLLASSHPAFLHCGAKVDAWFLDGFAPGSNPGMWSDHLFDCVAALSQTTTTFATFTAAGFVKRALQARGFTVEKVRGYGRKREMLRGFIHTQTPIPAPAFSGAKKENAAWHLPNSDRATGQKIAVIGAGLSGAHTARALARRGFSVSVFEAAATVAAEASGNPQGILYTKLSHQDGVLNRFALLSFLFALRHYRAFDDLPGSLCGVVQLLSAAQQERLQQSFSVKSEWHRFLDARQASEISGLPLDQGGLFYPQAGWIKPAELCKKLLDHPAIELHLNCPIQSLSRESDGWRLQSEEREFHADSVVVANSNSANRFEACDHLPLKPVRGQLSYLPCSAVTPNPETVVCHEGYLAPAVDGQLIIGASYDTHSTSLDLSDQEHQQNLDKLRQAIPGLQVEPSVTGGRAALRCTSPDYLPIVGPAPRAAAIREAFALLTKNAKTQIDNNAEYYPGLYLNLAHGSRGLTSAPLTAELLASQINHELAPLPRELIRALSPARFLIRDLIRVNAQ